MRSSASRRKMVLRIDECRWQIYEVRISALPEEDGGGFVAVVPELPGCMSDGATRQGALANVRDAITLWVETAEALGRTVPTPRYYEATAEGIAMQG